MYFGCVYSLTQEYLVILLFINYPASILNREAAWPVLKIVQLEVGTLVKNVNTMAI